MSATAAFNGRWNCQFASILSRAMACPIQANVLVAEADEDPTSNRQGTSSGGCSALWNCPAVRFSNRVRRSPGLPNIFAYSLMVVTPGGKHLFHLEARSLDSHPGWLPIRPMRAPKPTGLPQRQAPGCPARVRTARRLLVISPVSWLTTFHVNNHVVSRQLPAIRNLDLVIHPSGRRRERQTKRRAERDLVNHRRRFL